jgi:hypothetical protein
MPFRVFGQARQPGCRHLGFTSSDWLLAQSHWPAAVSLVLVERSHFAVSRFFGCVVFLQRASLATIRLPVESSLEFRLRLEYHRAKPSRLAAANRLLSWASSSLQHMKDRRSTSRGLARPLRSASRVWLPS